MKLSKYIEGLQKTLEKYGDVEAVYAIDDEGNAYHAVYFDPTPGFFNKRDEEFTSLKHVEDEPDEESYEKFVGQKPTAVCIN